MNMRVPDIAPEAHTPARPTRHRLVAGDAESEWAGPERDFQIAGFSASMP